MLRTTEHGWKRNTKQNLVTKTAPEVTVLCNISRCNNYIKIKIAVFPEVKTYGLVDTNVLGGPALFLYTEERVSSSIRIIGAYLPNYTASPSTRS
jgi:hypothetical protein